jgi:hypothetical protein
MNTLYAAVVDLPVSEAREQQPAVAIPRLPALERLLWRGERRRGPSDWRRWALGIAGLAAPPGDLPLGALLARAGGLAPENADTWFVATPLSLLAGLSDVRVARTPTANDAAWARELAARFNAEWGGEAVTLHALDGQLVLQQRGALEAQTTDPAALAGRGLGSGRPTGAGAGALERLMTEVQMWLHAVPLGAVPPRVNALWLWGGGRGALSGTAAWPTTTDDDPCLRAARHCHPGSTDGASQFVRWSVADLVAAGESLTGADRDWFAPLAHALAAGSLARAELHVDGLVVSLEKRQRRRVWIRPRPWWELGT